MRASDVRKVAWALVATLVVAVSGSAAAPRVITDKMAYVDGETVSVSGYGFLPFETVSIQLAGTDRGIARVMSAPTTVIADADGKIMTGLTLDPRDRFVTELSVVATGGSSKASVETAFSRSATLTAATPAPGAATVITGSNFEPNENVKLELKDGARGASNAWSVTADGAGAISSSLETVNRPLSSETVFAKGNISGLTALAMLAPGNFNIDGNIPDAGAFQFTDPFGSSSELGPVNSTNTKLLAVNGAPLPMLSFTNPNAQVDLRNIWMSTSVINNEAWLYFAWERDSNSGSGVIAFEFQQNARPAACDYTMTDQVDVPPNSPAGEAGLIAACNPWRNRQPGDFLIVWDQGGRAINIIKRTFYLNNQNVLALDAGVVLSAADASAAVSTDKFRGEAAVNLTRTVFPANPTSCFSIANIIPGTVTGNSDTADYKDTVLADFASHVAVSNCGQVRVTKATVPTGGTGSFPYTLARSGGQAVRFPGDGGETSLTDTLVSDGDADTIFDLITATNYTLTEGSVGPAYAMQSIVCGGTNITAGGTFSVTPSAVTDCTITNRLQNGTLIVRKVVTNDDGGTLGCSAFSFSVNNGQATAFESDCQNEISVDSTVTYSVTEPAVTGYAASYNNCSNVSVPAGGSATCTITNNDRPPQLKLVKSVTNNNGGTSAASAWQLTATGTGGFTDGGASTTFHNVRAAVQYTLSESSVSGYDFVSWSCNGGTFAGPDKITLALDQQVTCTVTNDDRKATPSVSTSERAVIHDSATISGARAGAPGTPATVTFRLYSDVACGTQVGSDETVGISGGVATTVNGVLVTSPGTYRWRAFYSGDAFNEPFQTACDSEIVTISF